MRTDIIIEIQKLLDEMVSFMDTTTWRDKYMNAIRSLQDELNTPCILAVAGKVKAGKSFLVNALLGVDIAMTGNTETTATINIFKKGKPLSKEKPILCLYTDGHKEWITKESLDALQGTSEEALAKTAQIDKLIMYIDDNPLLEYVTLVDTPGIGAVVGEEGDSHQIQTDSYFQLRKRHQQETIDLSNTADAIIYLFNTVPTETDKEFLSSLYDSGHGITSLNGIGVLSKIDKDLSLIKNIPGFCKDFEHNLFAIVPTSAAIEKYIPSYEKALQLRNQLLSGFESEKGIKLALSSEVAFLHEKLPYCKMSVDERKHILKGFAESDLAWASFALIAKELYDTENVGEALEKLKTIGGIESLKKIIFDHFFSRSQMLRGNKVLEELRRIITEIQYDDAYIFMEDRANMKDQCIKECQKLPQRHKELLIHLIQSHIPSLEKCVKDKNRVADFKYKIEKMQAALSLMNDKFILYRKIVAAKEQFSQAEFDELSSLFSDQSVGENPRARYKYWAAVANSSMANSLRQNAAKSAKKIYAESLNATV